MPHELPTPEQLGLPWEVHGPVEWSPQSGNFKIIAPERPPIASVPWSFNEQATQEHAKRYAAFIAHAANCFHPMLAALEAAVSCHNTDSPSGEFVVMPMIRAAVKNAQKSA